MGYEIIYVASTGIAYSRGGTYLMTGTIDEVAEAFIGVVIRWMEDY